jgi:PAS domain S-box-containing protein
MIKILMSPPAPSIIEADEVRRQPLGSRVVKKLGGARPWYIAAAAVGGLLVAIALAGLVGLVLNERISQVANEALAYDVALENQGNELRVAILDVRNQHHNLVFAGPTRGGVDDFESAHARLQREIDILEELGVRDPNSPQPDELRALARAYYEDFRPAVDLYGPDREAFEEASDRGLARLAELEAAAREVEVLGEELAAEALRDMDRVTLTSRWVLLSVLGGLALVGAGLAFVAVRTLRELRDLYAREQAAAAELSRSEERFRALVANSSDIISVFDADGTVVYQSPAHQRILGYEPEERVGQNVFELPHVHPDDLAAKRAFFDRTLASGPGELSMATFRLRDVGGAYHVMEAVGANRLDDPVVRGIVTNYRDVTERHRAEEALRFQKALLESQTEASIDGILVVSGGREILSFNRRYVEMWGLSEGVMESGTGEDVLRVVQEQVEDPEGFRGRVEHLYEHPEEEGHEEIPLKDGRVFDRYSAPVKGADGTYYGRVWYFRDITERKRIEEALARSLRSKTDFLADVSHELRTPLTVIRSNAEVGLELERGCVHGRMLEEIAKESQRMSRMVEDLLFIARSDSDSPPLEPEVVEAAPFLAGLAERAEALARERGAVFEARLGGEGRLRVDPARIEQAVLILMDNAAKYGPPGGSVTLSSAAEPGGLRIEVADRGPGIPEAELAHVFERFYRLKSNGGRGQGAGLGLSIARTIAELHGGRIEAASRPGEGTTMSLHLPLLTARRRRSVAGTG